MSSFGPFEIPVTRFFAQIYSKHLWVLISDHHEGNPFWKRKWNCQNENRVQSWAARHAITEAWAGLIAATGL
jgi:hypothetical protein